MKFYAEEITEMMDGTSAHALTEKPSENEALSAVYMALSSATINPNVRSIHVEAKNSVGGYYENKTWTNNNVQTAEVAE